MLKKSCLLIASIIFLSQVNIGNCGVRNGLGPLLTSVVVSIDNCRNVDNIIRTTLVEHTKKINQCHEIRQTRSYVVPTVASSIQFFQIVVNADKMNSTATDSDTGVSSLVIELLAQKEEGATLVKKYLVTTLDGNYYCDITITCEE